jgi:FAD-linked oxidoreductase
VILTAGPSWIKDTRASDGGDADDDGAAALLPSAMVAGSSSSGASPAPTSWCNWAGNQAADGLSIRRPHDTAETAAIVAACAADGTRVKATGSGHSFTAIGRPEAVAIDLSGCTRLRHFDPVTGRVVAEAGMTLRRLSVILAAAGRALINLGDIDVQTVGGAIATGTHGTGARFGGIATQVTGMELVIADGSVLWCSHETHRELWSTARIHLGALGIVTAVELETVPLFALAAEEGVMSLDQLLDQWDALVDESDHFEAYWFPHTGRVSTKRNTRVALEELAPRPAWRAWVDDSFLQNTAFGAAIALGRMAPAAIPTLNRVAAGALGTRTYCDLSYRVFATPRRVRFVEMEYAIGRDAAVETIRSMTKAVDGSGLPIAFPVELRAAAADDIALSTANGRDSAYVAVHVPAGTDHRAYFSLVAGWMDNVAGRPHWGKLHTLEATPLRARYPAFDAFTSLRRRLDPEGMFANAELDRVLGPVC